MTDREQFDQAMSQCGFGRDKKKPVRIAEIVGIHCLVMAGFVLIGLIWSHWF